MYLARWQATNIGKLGVFGLDAYLKFSLPFNFFTNFSQPSSRNGYTTFDLKIAKRIKNFKLILEGVNIFNKDYEELSKIEGSSRWFKIGIEYRF